MAKLSLPRNVAERTYELLQDPGFGFTPDARFLPAGYRNLRDPDNSDRGIVVADEPRFSLIRRSFRLLLTGAYTVAGVRRLLTDDHRSSTLITHSDSSKRWCH